MDLPTVDEALARLPYSRRTMYIRLNKHETPIGGWVREDRLSAAAVEILFPGKDWQQAPILTSEQSPTALVQPQCSPSAVPVLHSGCTGENDIVLDDIQARLTEALATVDRLETYAANVGDLLHALITTVQRLEARVTFMERARQSESQPAPGVADTLAALVLDRFRRPAESGETYTANRLRG